MNYKNEKRSFSIFEMVGFSLIAAAILAQPLGLFLTETCIIQIGGKEPFLLLLR